MIKDATRQIIKRTLQSSFNKEQFLNFTKNLLNHIDESKAFHAHGYVKEQFKKTTNIIKTYERLGTYTDPNTKKIDVLVVYLAKDNSIDRARTTLRNFAADYLKQRDQKDAALVAFVSPNMDDWRFSLIRMDYKFEEGKNGKIKVKEKFTPARRWSFLVGANESSHTAQSRLAPILEDDENKLTLEQLEDAFNIEKVTKEFFEKYRELFLRLKDNLDEMVKHDAKIKADFTEKDVDTVDFAKKLLGQIVFLYFLQKKGWFGVGRDANWGTGPKDFLRQLFEGKHSTYKNFFNEILEPMFYEALARERDDDYYGRFNCKIPFLNGGLFDPIGNYDWVHTDINLDNELFSNSQPTKQGDIGDGILDVFDRYNFTVREDEPLEKEVAVDPEMLGKVFENLLEVKDRKSKGTYYTPREIVHYMCEQSLRNYLASETGTDKDTFDHLIQLEQLMAQKLPRDGKLKAVAMWEGEVKKIEEALDNIKIVDPACGSGAFLVGMMQEIVELRKIIRLFFKTSELTDYEFKSAIIQNNLYGVDIDPGAVEIAKLRLWLSLVVDENDIKQIKPLPNLDYKIMQGNSLLEEFEGIKLFDESIIPQDHTDHELQIVQANEKINALQREYIKLHSNNELPKQKGQLIKQRIKDQQKLIQSLQNNPEQVTAVDLFNQIDEIKAKWDELTGLHKKIVSESNRQAKKKMLDRATELEWEFIEASLRHDGKSESIKKMAQFKKRNTKPFFLWHLHFADTFQEKGGFDVVIANPPYINSRDMAKGDQSETRKTIQKNYAWTKGSWDIYIAFFELGFRLLNKHAALTFITPDKWIAKPFGQELRKASLKYTTAILKAGREIFEDAKVDSIVSSFSCVEKKDMDIVVFESGRFNLLRSVPKTFLSPPFAFDHLFSNELNFLTKLDNIEGRLFEIAICENACATDDAYKLKPLIEESSISALNGRKYMMMVNTGTIGKYHVGWGQREMTYLGKRYLRPVVNKDRFSNLFRNSYSRKSSQPKIIIKGLNLLDACLDRDGAIIPGIPTLIIASNVATKLKLLLAIINSKLAFFYIKERYPSSSYNQGVNFTVDMINNLPIPTIKVGGRETLINLVDQILHVTECSDYPQNIARQSQVKEYRHQIDQIFYKLYDLSPDEIKSVESIRK